MEDLISVTFEKTNSSQKQFGKNRCLIFEEYSQQSSNPCYYFDSMDTSSSNTLYNDSQIKSIIKNSNQKKKEKKKVTFKNMVEILLVESFKEYQLSKGSFIDINLENENEDSLNQSDEDNFKKSQNNQHNQLKTEKPNKNNEKIPSSNEISLHFQMKKTTIVDSQITWNKDVCKCIVF